MNEVVEREINRNQIVNQLMNGECTVSFKKADGTLRVMKCTLKPDLLPVFEEKTEKKARKVNEDVIAVFDVENNGWRSFRVDSVVSIAA